MPRKEKPRWIIFAGFAKYGQILRFHATKRNCYHIIIKHLPEMDRKTECGLCIMWGYYKVAAVKG